MANKVKLFPVIFCLVVTLTGCNDVIDLTDEQSHLIAEYAAELLLKYDRTYEDRIEDGMWELSRMEATSEDGIPEEVTTEAEVTTEEIETTESTTSETVKDLTEESTVTENVESEGDSSSAITTEESVNEYSVSSGDIARFAGLKDVSIKYKDYIVTDQYPAIDEEGKFIYLEASKGFQLLVVRFAVTNNTDDNVDVSLIDNEIDYRIVCNGKNAAKPMLTILMDDLGTLETTVKPNEEQEAVLVFQIADSMKDSISSMELKVNYEGVDNVIKIK